MPIAMQGNHELYLADATIFMKMASILVIAQQWLKIATAAKQALVTGNTKFDVDFYESKLHTMKFYFKYELPEMNACLETMMSNEELTIMKEEAVNVFN
jgi:butyryl-CoA dehydrogenase